MGILFILAVLIIPYLWGCLVTGFGKGKDSDNLTVYLSGLSAFFILMLGLILVALKADLDFNKFTLMASILFFGPAVMSLPFLVTRLKSGTFKKPSMEKKTIGFIIAATVLGLISIVFTNQSYVNDATIETVRTTLESGKIYVFSSLDGKLMINGLPIYNKVFIIPLFYAFLSKVTFTDITLITGLIVPALTYVINLLIMWKIGKLVVSKENHLLFMFAHLVLLIGGTFLPGTAIPVSLGFPLLRQGYTGYAWAYGVIVPFAVLLLLQKKYFRGFVALVSLAGLLKIDSIFFAIKDFSNSYYKMGASGKLWIMYLVAVFYGIYASVEMKKKFNWQLLLTGCGFISWAICDLYATLAAKESKQVRHSFLAWMALAALACVSFMPYSDARISLALDGSNKDLREVIDTLENWQESVPCEENGKLVVAGCSEVMNYLRIATTKVTPAYGRDMIEPLLSGYNYERPEEGQEYLIEAVTGIESDYKVYSEADILDCMIENWQLEHTDVLVFSAETVITENIWNKLMSYGFDPDTIKVRGKYQYIHR